MKGIVTEIQRFSLKDGPGIRTTVFLKGCNMACKWCHNPETLSMGRELMRHPEHCISCGACISACRHGAMASGRDGGVAFSRDKCVSCGACADGCFTGALAMSGTEMGVDDVMREVMQDADYYRNSGGGITISGGEAMCQPEFADALLRAARDAGVSTAIETNMLADWNVYERLLPALDLVMLDIKLACDSEHRRWTGAGNARVLANAAKIAGRIPTIIRTPIIPGVNDSAEAISPIASFIKGLGGKVEYYELLLYNPLGEGKYRALGMEHLFSGAKPAGEERQALLRKVAEGAGVPVRIG
ncbi:MAG: glycyl-radical enzyme activating protein [Clostridiales bacterium]|jgi:pyruvate formate lyase activating enzyme|nr:glycyl-radical enzyme activating protein [Clostridiales bacterium]